MHIAMRPARATDSDDLFSWRNDPHTRAMSKTTEPVERADHDRWMQFNVTQGYPQHIVLIAESDVGSVGVVRFDAKRSDVMVYETSITIAPQHRGQGHAADILNRACGYMNEYTLLAEIKRENYPSMCLFQRCGFTRVGGDDTYLQFRRPPA